MKIADLNVLCVDSDENTIKQLCSVLDSRVKSVTVAKDGQEGLETYNALKEQLHVVITEIFLPVLGGQVLIDHILQSEPEMMIITVSGYSMTVSAHCNADITLQKPIQDEDIVHALEAYCERFEEE